MPDLKGNVKIVHHDISTDYNRAARRYTFAIPEIGGRNRTKFVMREAIYPWFSCKALPACRAQVPGALLGRIETFPDRFAPRP